MAFDIPRSRVTGRVTVEVGRGETARFSTGTLTVRGAALNGRPLTFAQSGSELSVAADEAGVLDISYEGVFKGGGAVGDRNYGVVESTIDGRGISLTGLWHPRPAGLAVWKLTATLPAGYEAVSEAESAARSAKSGAVEFTFDLPRPVEGLSLVATDRYEVTRDRHGSVELAAYFFKEDRSLARAYLDAAKRYLDLYEKMLTPFPFRRFAIVENFLPTGYSMPTFTLLGQDVVRLPFITETSLGHEILHQWFGNSVYIDDRAGNWAEGLTTYLADHWYEELKGTGWQHRKQLLVNYAAYVHGKSDTPLRDFRSRMDPASRAIGYGKAAMVFHMVRLKLGDAAFFGALRDIIAAFPFREASWDDLAASFGRRADNDLKPFFAAWTGSPGLPAIDIESASVRRKGSRYEVTLKLLRKGGSQPVDVPVVTSFLATGATRTDKVSVTEERTSITLLVDDEPAETVIDPDYDVARMPTTDELPPVIARLMGDAHPVIVTRDDTETYGPVIAELGRQGAEKAAGAEQRLPSAIKDAEMRTSSLIILGADNPVVKRLFGSLATPAAGLSVTVRRNPLNSAKIVAVVHARSSPEAEAVSRIAHYGKYSALEFDKGRNRSKTIAPSERGIIVHLRDEPVALDMAQLRRMDAVVNAALSKKVVYVGEYHDRFSHHSVQLRIIRELYRRDPALAVGMEMFQRPFQKTLDDYIAGTISEREFLEKSEYFKRWGFDYNLYKPLLDFCRSEKVPVVALNIRREITEKVAKDGMDALTAEERAELPAEMDLSDEEYRGRLRQVFEQHRESGDRSFDNFYAAQVIWDETMAESISGHLKQHPGRRMVVVAGGGHIANRAGIPNRAFRRTGLPFLTIVNDGEVDPAVADFVVLPQALEGMTAPKLMATFREEGDQLVFNDFVKESPARAAGIEAGDTVIAVDGVPVGSLQDLKLALFFRSKGDIMLITVTRKRFLLGDKVMTVEVKL